MRSILKKLEIYQEERYITEALSGQSKFFPDDGGLQKAEREDGATHALVLVHGFASKHKVWDDFVACATQDERFREFDFYSFQYDSSFESAVDLDDAALSLSHEINRIHQSGSYKSVLLVGHSIGGLVARAAVLYGRGKRGAVEYPWAGHESLQRVVLIASLNRGTRYFEQHRLQRFFARLKYKPKDRPFFLEQFLHGSPFVNNLRLDWILAFNRPEENPPEVVQVYGEADGSHNGDRWVKKNDSEDLLSLPNTIQIPSMGRGHARILMVKSRNDAAYLTLRSAMLDSFPHIQQAHASAENRAKSFQPTKGLVFLVHGIRTYAEWIQPLRNKITAEYPGYSVIEAGYGYFSTLHFLLPWYRQKKMAEFTDTYMLNLARHPDVPRYAVAHSFGTYVVGQSLANHPKMSFDRAYFTGSVLPRTFNWYGLDGHRQIIPQQLNSLRNDCAVNDWPVGFLCSALNKLGEGRLGTGGFRGFARTESGSMVQFKDYFPGGHSAPLNDHDNRDTICKFLLTGAEVGMAKKQPQPVSRSEKFLHATSENAAAISVLALVLLFAGAPVLIAYLSGSVFAAALVFFLLAGSIIWVLNAI